MSDSRVIFRNFLSITFITLISYSYSVAQDSGDAQFDKAYDLYNKGKYKKAIPLFDEIESKHANNEEFFLIRGLCYSEMGDDDRAITNYNKALELNIDYAEGYYQRGFSYFSIGYNSKAIQDFNQAIRINPKYAEAYLNRGSVKYDARDDRGACKDWNMASKLGLTVADNLIKQICE